jgi:nitrile hydratase accessory protein
VSEPSFAARLDAEGPAAPPRTNGELVFEAPWESRVFGMTMTLCDQGRFTWDEFREFLIEEIARRDEAYGEDGRDYRYWEHWLAALTRLLGDKALLASADLEARQRELAGRPPGRDHDHPHDPS